MKYTEKQIQEFLDGIYDGTYTPHELPESLYYAIADYLKRAVYEGFGGEKLSDFKGTKDYALVNELSENIYMFSAAKTHAQVVDISSLLLDGDRVRSRSEFNKLGRERYDVWNNEWGKSEYNTAIASASMANKWQDIEASKDILPVVTYSTIGDACEICRPLDGLTFEVDDPKLKVIYPPNHFNCMCLMTQHESDKKPTPEKDVRAKYDHAVEHMSDVFKMNSGIDKVIFDKEHPYFDVAPKDKKFAANNFDLPIPKKD